MIKFLLDTNILIWYFEGSDRVNPAKEYIISPDSDIYYSTASLWEIAIKARKKKININLSELRLFFKKHNFIELPIDGSYITTYLNLPKIHKDPFDHIMLAQAITSLMRFITGDKILAEYSSLVMVI